MNRRFILNLVCIASFVPALQAGAAPAETPPARRAWLTLNPSTVIVKMTMPPGIPKDVIDTLPGLNGAPKRSMNISLSSPQMVRETAKAEIDLPEGLKTVKTLSFDVDNVQSPKKDDPQFKMRYYFGCGAAVPAGQPVAYTLASWLKLAGPLRGSYGIPFDPSINNLPKEASAKGPYTLRSYAGNLTVNFPAESDFMNPLEIVSPKMTDTVDTSKPVTVSWNKVPRAKAYMVTAFGMNIGDDSEGGVMWWSAGDPKFGVVGATGYSMLGADILQADRVKRGWYLGPDTTKCTIPAGILSPGSPFTITVTAYGEEKIITQRFDATTKTNVPVIPAIAILPQATTTLTLRLAEMPGPVGGANRNRKVPSAPTNPGEAPRVENVPTEPPAPEDIPSPENSPSQDGSPSSDETPAQPDNG